MTITTKALALIVTLSALVAATFTYAVTSLVRPEPAIASDSQIVRALKDVIGTSPSDFDSLRYEVNVMRSEAKEITAEVKGITTTLTNLIGDSEYDTNSLRGQIKDMCTALGGKSYNC
jgi:hypothetical protein